MKINIIFVILYLIYSCLKINKMKHYLRFMSQFVILFLALLSTAIASCSRQSDDSISTSTSTLNDVTFSSQIATRVSGVNFELGDIISVTALLDGVVCNDGVGYEYDGSLFSSANPIELEESQSLTYIASYPPQQGVDRVFSFSVEQDQSSADSYESSDLLMAIESSSSLEPCLNFKHIMSSIVVYIDVTNSDGDDIALDSFVMNAVAEATVECDIESGDVTVESASSSCASIEPLYTNGGYLSVFAPQFVEKGHVMATAVVDGVEYNWIMEQDIELESGKQYNYQWQLTIGDDVDSSIVDLDSMIDPWEGVDITPVDDPQLLDIALFSSMSLSGDATMSSTGSSYGDVSYAFDGVNPLLDFDSSFDANGVLTDSGSSGKCITIDLGAEYILTNFTFWQRRWSYIYSIYNIKSFRLWGADSAASYDGVTIRSDYQEVDGGGFADFDAMGDKWVELLYVSEVEQPSTDIATASDYGGEYADGVLTCCEVAALAGHSYAIEAQSSVRYLRIEFIETWGSGYSIYMLSEIALMGR